MQRKLITFLILCLVLLSPAMAADSSSIEKARALANYRLGPLNPDFIAFIKYHLPGESQDPGTGGHGLGLVPTPFSLKNFLENWDFAGSSSKNASNGTMKDAARDNVKALVGYRLAPLNPDFERFIRDHISDESNPPDLEGHALGLIPPLIDIGALSSSDSKDTIVENGEILSSQLDSPGAAWFSTAASPGRYDLRTTGKLTPVRDQGQCGACWAFSTYGSLESTNLPETTWDFSENNLKNTHGFDLSTCQGGNYQMSTAYLARWSGPVGEGSDPYSESGSISSTNLPVLQNVQQVNYLPSRTGPLDNALIKQMLQQYGALYSQIRWESGSYTKNPASYCYQGTSIPNHAVVIVGWDDSYSRFRFASPPAGDGAFIVRNSWGDDWGDGGYFYVSYYDSWIGRPSVQYYSEDPGKYDRVYQYDPLGWVISFGSGTESAWFANIFTSTQTEELHAVSFYTPVQNSAYRLEVYKDVGSTPRGRVASLVQEGSIAYAGYHTIDLSAPISLQRGQKFSIVVSLVTPGYNYPVAIEYPYSGYSSRATARAGESWVSSDGTAWSDLSVLFPNTNACLKAFTQTSVVTPTTIPTTKPSPTPTLPATSSDRRAPTVTLSSPKFMASYSPGSVVPLEWTAKDNVEVTHTQVEYSSDRGVTWTTLLADAPSSGEYSWTLPSSLLGSVSIRVTAEDAAGNSGSATRSITVKSPGQAIRTLAQSPHLTQGRDGTINAAMGYLTNNRERLPTGSGDARLAALERAGRVMSAVAESRYTILLDTMGKSPQQIQEP